MKTALFIPKDGSANEQASTDGKQEIISPGHHEINTMEGSEFLDDAIRMKDQPYCEKPMKENE